MSVKYLALVWELDLPHTLAWVLMALADHADQDGLQCFPSLPKIAWKTGYSRRQIQRIMAQLRDAGLVIEMESEPGKSVCYGLDFSRCKQKPKFTRKDRNVVRQNVTPDKMSPPAKCPGGVDTHMSRGGGHMDVHLTINQPSDNHPTTSPSSRTRPQAPAAPNGGDGGGDHKKTLLNALRAKPGEDIPWAKIAKAARHPTDTALAVLSACGCPVAKHQAAEWATACGSSQIGALIAIATWRRSIGEPIRQPSGLRRAIELWCQLPISDRKNMAAHVASCLAGAA